MRFILMLLFNALAVYLLFVYATGNGGMIDELKKSNEVFGLEKQKLSLEIEKEDLRSRLAYLKNLSSPDNASMVSFGKKNANMVVFKFREKENKSGSDSGDLNLFPFIRIYFYLGLTVVAILVGDIILFAGLFRIKRQRG